MKPTDWTLYDWVNNPPEAYQKMRKDGSIHWNKDYHGWLVIDYEYARDLLKDERLSADTTEALLQTTFPIRSRSKVEPLLELYRTWLMFADPPYHTAMRKIFNPFFGKTALEKQSTKMAEHAHALLDKCGDEWDVMQSFAGPLPLLVMFDLMGLPYECLEDFAIWNAQLARFIETTIRSPDVCDEALEAMEAQKSYFNGIIASSSKDAFVSRLCRSITEENLLEKEDHWKMFSMILAAGTETTHNLIGSGLYALLSHPEQYQLLRDKPELLDSAIEECLRYYSPIQSVFRVARENIEIGEVLIEKGHYVRVVLGAINRDPAGFEKPEVFDITRDPNKHLSFGAGIHFCIGRLMAKQVAEIAFPMVLKDFPDLRLVTKDPEWIGGTTFRGIKSFWVSSC